MSQSWERNRHPPQSFFVWSITPQAQTLANAYELAAYHMGEAVGRDEIKDAGDILATTKADLLKYIAALEARVYAPSERSIHLRF